MNIKGSLKVEEGETGKFRRGRRVVKSRKGVWIEICGYLNGQKIEPSGYIGENKNSLIFLKGTEEHPERDTWELSPVDFKAVEKWTQTLGLTEEVREELTKRGLLHVYRAARNGAANHYEYLEEALPRLFQGLGLEYSPGIIVAHGDKCYGYKEKFEAAGLTFGQGVAIYILTYLPPFSDQCRQVGDKWIDPAQWVVDNKDRFLPLLPV